MKISVLAAPFFALFATSAFAALPTSPLSFEPLGFTEADEFSESDLRRVLAELELHLSFIDGLPWADQNPQRDAVEGAADYLRNLLKQN